MFLVIAVALLVAEDDGGFALVARWMTVIGLGGITYQHLAHAYFNTGARSDSPEADV
ncbi:hypothetical protein GCM10009737_32450 [Nocardioides lentus]|uniref:Uncharacterized protein n=1 Tax=Nocardioides lentus TaxID=338077 RepID=A0ABN2PR71_9ACTN